MAKRTVIAFWLMPAAAEKDLFRRLTRILARELSAPLFEPHITLFALDMQPPDARRILKTIQLAPVRLQVRGVACSEKFTKTLFVRFSGARVLEPVLSEFRRKAGRPVQRLIDPHLSLCYKKMPAAAKRQLAAVIELPMKAARFDTIKAVRCVFPTRTAHDVEAWRTIATRRLRP